ncbi:hypothetical protein N1F89_19425 [Aquibium sp. A9E412]|uniref:hypothetical protein n=1 Tax=Aquibium sp. A9E412 TaxID=2976767 RepID=UPI0025B10C88|nr:hypothetical protein [Aquibium sp. A9E412]MDN2568401.1 hypothetical protein [Aquibium sp. A9E412]
MRRAARLVLAGLALAATAAPAAATGTISCAAPTASVTAELSIGRVPGLAVVGARITAEGQTWSIEGNKATPIVVAQAFTDGRLYQVDFADANVEAIVAELRLSRADERRDAAMAGTLRLPGLGAWPVVCVGE